METIVIRHDVTHQVAGITLHTSLETHKKCSSVRRTNPEQPVGHTPCRHPYPFFSDALFSSLFSVASRKRWAYSLRVWSSLGKTCVTASNVSRIFTIPSAIISANRAKGRAPTKRNGREKGNGCPQYLPAAESLPRYRRWYMPPCRVAPCAFMLIEHLIAFEHY